MPVTILAFGPISEITGSRLVLEAADVTALQAELHRQYPVLAGRKYAIAVNKKLITDNMVLSDGDTIALMPPYSGG